MDMKGLPETSDATSSLPSVRTTILRGAWLGIHATAIGSVLFLVTDVALGSLLSGSRAVGSVNASLLFWLVVFFLLGFLIAVFPGVIGGGTIGLILRILGHRGKLSTAVGLAVGILVGACAGCMVIQIARLLEPEMVDQSSVEAFIAAMLSAVLAGLWHSWRFARWLQRVQTRS